MRKLKLHLFLALMVAIPLMFLTSCQEDDGGGEETNQFQPVLGENFEFAVSGNDVTFTTTMTGNVWATIEGTDYTFVDQEVTVKLPNAGTYTATVSSLGSGEELTSDPFDIEILQDDLSFLNEGLWKALSGGANETKTWRMDIDDAGQSVYFDGPLYYSGHDEEPYWSWDVLPEELPVTVAGDELTSFFNWQPAYQGNEWLMPAQNYGTITFDATNNTVTTEKFGQEESGTFQFDDETWKLTLSGVTLPIDTGRVNQGQFEEEDLYNLRIYSLSDSAMQIGVKRSYEPDENGDLQESEWVHVYNFVVVGYDYPVITEPDPEEPILTSFTQDDLVGTWEFAPVPYDWIGWAEANPLNNWADPADMVATGWAITQEALDAAMDDEFVFNADGTANLNGNEVEYSVSDGVITFNDSTGIAIDWFTVGGTTMNVLDVQGAAIEGGIWIGKQNEAKLESAAFHLVRKED